MSIAPERGDAAGPGSGLAAAVDTAARVATGNRPGARSGAEPPVAEPVARRSSDPAGGPDGIAAAGGTAPSRQRAALRIVLGAMLLLSVAAGLVALRVWPDAISRLIDQATALERALGAAGWALAALVQLVIALCGILPASVGALAAGLLYGVAGGFCVSAFGTLAGAALAFALTRTLFRPVIARVLARRPRFRRLDEAVARDGWRLVCLLRISPVMPFAVTSYALGLSSLDFRSYAIGTLASLPALLGYVVLGHLSGNGLNALAAHQTGWLHWCLLALAIGATTLLTVKIGGFLRQALRLPPDAT